MIDTAIAGLVDILGYESMVERHMDNLDLIQGIETLLEQSTVGIIEKLKDVALDGVFGSPVIEDYYNNIVDAISIQFISDTILFILQFSKMRFWPSIYTEEETISHHIHLYLTLFSNFCTLFMAKTGLLLRGGVSIGPHYEGVSSRRGNNFFVFSKAYINAHNLEQAAEKPRIIIDDEMWSYLKEISFDGISRYFYKDGDGRNCFEFYCFLRRDEHSRGVLTDIKRGLRKNLETNEGNREILTKLIYFAEYHNSRVARDKLDCEQLAVDYRKWE